MVKSPDAFRTISEVSEWLDTPTYVLRFWESRFPQVKPVKRAGGRRYYRPDDMLLLGGIKKLLHFDEVSIKEVKKLLKDQGVKHVMSLSPDLDTPVVSPVQSPDEDTKAEIEGMVAQATQPVADTPPAVSVRVVKKTEVAEPESQSSEPPPASAPPDTPAPEVAATQESAVAQEQAPQTETTGLEDWERMDARIIESAPFNLRPKGRYDAGTLSLMGDLVQSLRSVRDRMAASGGK